MAALGVSLALERTGSSEAFSLPCCPSSGSGSSQTKTASNPNQKSGCTFCLIIFPYLQARTISGFNLHLESLGGTCDLQLLDEQRRISLLRKFQKSD